MAMHLSRARRDTLHPAPVPIFSSSQQSSSIPPNEDHVHTFSSPGQEEVEMIHDTPFDADAIPLPPLQCYDPSLLVNDDQQASNFGLPIYQANASQSAFDFVMMEEFAVAEKTKLGLNAPATTHFSLSALRGRPKPDILHRSDTEVASGSAQPAETTQPGEPITDGGEEPTPRPLRHRKLSQSHPRPRSHRKGIGGKMAMFESNNNDTPSSFSARLGILLNTQPGPGSSYESIAGPPGTSAGGGILLNTGHDRPYRFSFYSNALSATIHARSLSELPADGQTFEQLFTGLQPHTNPVRSSDASEPPAAATGVSPPYQETISNKIGIPNSYGTNSSNHGPGSNASNNLFRRSINGQLEKAGPGGGGGMGTVPDDQDVNTWWLDVQNPTDEEMKMLSKVCDFASFYRAILIFIPHPYRYSRSTP